jgi:predicted GNAT superfamily acetyltransferase
VSGGGDRQIAGFATYVASLNKLQKPIRKSSLMRSFTSQILVRPLTECDELDACVEVQRAIWGADAEVDERALLVVASRFAGQVLGAFDGDRMIGMALAFHMAWADKMHSHRVGVLPEYQGRGVGRSLKLAQRTTALAQGVQTIEWTFDPLQSLNAKFNLVHLGGIARAYLPNLYGASASPLHGMLPTDRLLIEWELDSARVASALAGRPIRSSADAQRVALPPRDCRSDAAHQARLRERLETLLGHGYAVTSFTTEDEHDSYILETL